MSAAPRGPVVAVVPLRDGTSGKSRLAAALDPAARRRLVVALARHVLTVLTTGDPVDRVVVVTADPAFVAEVLADQVGRPSPARRLGLPIRTRAADPAGVELIAEPTGRPGLNAALEHARREVRQAVPGRLLVVHADLPLLTPDDVAAVLADPADVVVATDRHGTGTNLLAVPLGPAPAGADRPGAPRGGSGSPVDAFAFGFGVGSRAAHVERASAAGLGWAVVDRPGTALDLDTLADWDDLPVDVRDRLRAVVGSAPA